MPYVHRLATPADLPQIVAIYNATIPSRQVTADLEPVSVESRQQWFAEHQPQRRPLWVVDGAAGIVAWLSFSSFYGRPAYDATVELSLYVANAARRQGIGTYLLKKAIADAPTLHITHLLAFIFEHNTPSLALFKQQGFAQWGRLPDIARLDNCDRTLIILGRTVSGDAMSQNER